MKNNDIPFKDNYIINQSVNNDNQLEISDNISKSSKKDKKEIASLETNSDLEKLGPNQSLCFPTTFFRCSYKLIIFTAWIISTIILFSVEPIFRKKLWKINEEKTVELQKHLDIDFFKFITEFGDETVLIIISFIVYMFFPLKTLYAY
jgi:hypothetical protein